MYACLHICMQFVLMHTVFICIYMYLCMVFTPCSYVPVQYVFMYQYVFFMYAHLYSMNCIHVPVPSIFIWKCVCSYVCGYVCVFASMYVSMHVWMYGIYVNICVFIYGCIEICTGTILSKGYGTSRWIIWRCAGLNSRQTKKLCSNLQSKLFWSKYRSLYKIKLCKKLYI